MTKIKICGLKGPRDIEAVNEALPDYIGFVFAKSRRMVSHEQASDMKSRLSDRILAVGVFVNAALDEIAGLCKDRVIDLVQLHGDEDASYLQRLRSAVPNPIIKAVRVQNAGQVLSAQSLPCDYLLLDAYRENVYGGSGESFDWSVIPTLNKPFFLAGGLKPENVGAALEIEPYCLDVSSGAETGGVKDRGKIRKIVETVRRGK